MVYICFKLKSLTVFTEYGLINKWLRIQVLLWLPYIYH